MKKFFLFLVFVLMSVNVAACTLSNKSQSPSGSSDGASTSCDKPPKVLEWSGKSYHLKAENTTSEPGLKYGFMKCDKGKFTLGNADNAFTVYSVGNPDTNSDIIFIGNWGRVLYSVDTNSKSTTSSQPTATVNPATSSQPTTTTDEKGQLVASFSSKSQDKQLSIYKKISSTSPLTAQITDNIGKTDNRSNILIQKDWEKSVQKDNIFASIHSASNINWILLTSDPAAGQLEKTLYKTEDNGESWVLVKDVSQIVDGYVTGLSFHDEKNGWISATQHGTALLPLYRTKDGGKSWSIQKIDIPKGYKYGNAYPPIFDEKDAKQGTLKIEFVSDSDKKTVGFKTTDGGETWKS